MMSVRDEALLALARRYRRFAEIEARAASPAYEVLARAVATSPPILAFLADLPPDRQQPNLFLAAVRSVADVPTDRQGLERIVRDHTVRLRALMLARTTQTNEPGRCAVLLPLLARLPQPLALLEVGASAGLCLLPDRYGYAYDDGTPLLLPDPSPVPPPLLPCRLSGGVPAPTILPRVVWRRGLDLNPLDLGSADDVTWLETLVWPGQDDRLHRLRAAIAIGRANPPPIQRGDLLTDLPRVAATAPEGATLVVFHTAVLSYVARQADRDRFAAAARATADVWISNEAAGVFPDQAARAPAPPQAGAFLVSVNGEPVAWAGPHGQSFHGFGSRPPAADAVMGEAVTGVRQRVP